MELFAELGGTWGEMSPLLRHAIESLGVLVLSVVMRVAILRVVQRNVSDSRAYYSWRKGTQYVFSGVAITMIASIWFQGTKDLATYLGLLSAGLAVALKDPLTNIIGWGYIMWQRPFGVGDRIEINGISGDVIDQRIFSFTMLELGNWIHAEQSTGRVLHLPNAHIFSHALFNYTEPFAFIWDEIPLTLTFESDWRLAKGLMLEVASRSAETIVPEARAALDQASRKTLIHFNTLSPIVYTTAEATGVKLVVRYLAHARRRRAQREVIWEGILDAFAEHVGAIEFAPTHRLSHAAQPLPPTMDHDE